MLLDKDHRSHIPPELCTNMSPPPVQCVSHKLRNQLHEDLHAPPQNWCHLHLLWASLVAQRLKPSACNAGDLGSIPGSGRSPGNGNGTPLQYSCLENPMDGGAWWATVHGLAKSRTQLSDFTSLKHIKSIFLVMKAYHKYSLPV